MNEKNLITPKILKISLKLEEIKRKNFERIQKSVLNSKNVNSVTVFKDSLNEYLSKILERKNIKIVGDKINSICDGISSIITGNYEIGKNDTFEKADSRAESIGIVIGYSDEEKLKELLEDVDEFVQTVGNGSVASGIIFNEEDEINKDKIADANNRFSQRKKNFKEFFKESLYNVMHVNEKIANLIAYLSCMDKEESNELNKNIAGKLVGGIFYEFLSGTLIEKRHFTDVTRSKSIIEKINSEGLLHFSSLDTCKKIIESGNVKASDFMTSDMTKKKSFFFAGIPKFEDVLINIPATNVMTAVRIKPNEEQINNLKYRALNDRAVTNDGKFSFSQDQVDIAYYGLMYNEKERNIYLGEITEEQAKNYIPPQEVKKMYKYANKSGFVEYMKLNAYGFYAEYKHHQKLLALKKQMREKGLTYRDLDDSTLVDLADFEQAYVETKDDAVERKNILEKIKERIHKKDNPGKDNLEENENEI